MKLSLILRLTRANFPRWSSAPTG